MRTTTLLTALATLPVLPGTAEAQTAKAALAAAAAPQASRNSGKLAWAQFPAPVRETIQKEMGVVPQDGALGNKTLKNGKIEYRASVTIDKRKVRLRVSDTGGILYERHDEDLGPDGLPKPILKAAKSELGGKPKILAASRTTKDGEVRYDIEAETGERAIELRLAQDGSFLRRREEAKKSPAAAPVAGRTTATTKP